MEKIKLANGQEFELIPCGIMENTMSKRRIFKFISSLGYDEVKALLLYPNNLASIDYILADGSITRSYTDCVTLKTLSKEFGYRVNANTTSDIYVMELSTDATEKTIQALQNEVTSLKSSNQTLQDTVDVLVLNSLTAGETSGTADSGTAETTTGNTTDTPTDSGTTDTTTGTEVTGNV